jgi:predicted transcriptional regulator
MMQSAISSSSFERRKRKSNGGTNRGKIQITADILCLSTVAIKKTHIMYKANLSYEQVNYYLTDMLNNDLISQHILEDGIVYRTSEKGREYLTHYARLMDLIMNRENQKELTHEVGTKNRNISCNIKA